MANKDKQIEKRKQEMERRKAEAEAREQAVAAKKKKRVTIAVVAAVLVVAITCAIAIPVAVAQHNKYMEVNFKTFKVPTTVAEAQTMQQYNHRNVVMTGYSFPCTAKANVLCKSAVSSCPYVTGVIPDNGIVMKRKDGKAFNLGNNEHIRIYGRMEINTVAVEQFEGQDTYIYLIVDKVEEI